MFDKYKDSNKNIKINDMNAVTDSHLDSIIAYGPYNLGIVDIEKRPSLDSTSIKDLTK
ncbi:hypothetical protein CDLVIII_4005 [Clostridium sp. DL-VIII]|uniref:hypothetical protein n=1 Tax=Clostridium sp. DL-VIII TaxID=641107 RepID=UPI00023AF8D6|nr:hypothetical protein [Clostridium sp. DL-VIII]EHJ00543.1 hypothetical protein CDLVIII_4005 [Clostridium sp. DL-VIII]